MRPFTRTDVWCGAMHAWGGFMVLMLIAFTAAVLITAGVGDGLPLVPMVAVVAGISAIATAYGRWRAARTGRIRPLRDPDAAAEGATLVATD